MHVNLDVDVVDAGGDPVSGAEVYVSYHHPVSPSTGLTEYTESDGHAEFDHESPEVLELTLYCEGDEYGTYDYQDGASYTVTI